MRLFKLAAFSPFAVAASSITAQPSTNATYIAEQITLIPQCPLQCLAAIIPMVGCSFTNTTCQCASQRLVVETGHCLMNKCTLPDSLILSKVQDNICQRPYESRTRKIRIMAIVCAIMTNSAVILRVLTRFLLNQPFGWDDLFVIVAGLLGCTTAGLVITLADHGFGEHVWTINIDTVPNLFLWLYICEILYVTAIGFIKLSLLFFYLRVFPKKSFRILCWLTMAFCLSSLGAFFFAVVFQCSPITYIWNKNLDGGGKCININAVSWSLAAINIVQDFLIIILPIHETKSLQLSFKRKVGLMAMFGVGGFVCITSVVRFHALRTFGVTADPTWDNIPTVFWSTLETSAAIVCSCMPSIRAGVAGLFPALDSAQSMQSQSSGLNPKAQDSYPKRGNSMLVYFWKRRASRGIIDLTAKLGIKSSATTTESEQVSESIDSNLGSPLTSKNYSGSLMMPGTAVTDMEDEKALPSLDQVAEP